MTTICTKCLRRSDDTPHAKYCDRGPEAPDGKTSHAFVLVDSKEGVIAAFKRGRQAALVDQVERDRRMRLATQHAVGGAHCGSIELNRYEVLAAVCRAALEKAGLPRGGDFGVDQAVIAMPERMTFDFFDGKAMIVITEARPTADSGLAAVSIQVDGD